MTEAEQATQKWNFSERRKGMRKFRKKAGITLDELAAEAHLSKSTLSRFETGKIDLTPESWAKLWEAIQNLPAKRRAAAREADLKLTKEFSIGFVGELIGKLVPLSLLGGREAQEQFDQKMREGREKMERTYGPHWKEVFGALFELSRENKDLEKRIAELRDLLQLETEAALKESERDELREKIKARDSGGEEE